MVDRSEDRMVDRMVAQMVGWAPEHLAQPEVLELRVKSGLTGASGLSLERSRPQRIGGGRLQVVRIQPVERMLPAEEGLPKKVMRLSVRLACSAAKEECVERLHHPHRLQHR